MLENTIKLWYNLSMFFITFNIGVHFMCDDSLQISGKDLLVLFIGTSLFQDDMSFEEQTLFERKFPSEVSVTYRDVESFSAHLLKELSAIRKRKVIKIELPFDDSSNWSEIFTCEEGKFSLRNDKERELYAAYMELLKIYPLPCLRRAVSKV